MKILLTGATGYIGHRLLPALVEDGHYIYCLARDKQRLQFPDSLSAKIEIIEADLLQPATLSGLPKDIDAAYYLVHSMSQSSKTFEEMEENSARNFLQYLNNTACRQIIYLGGMTYETKKSAHLASRIAVENILMASGIACTSLRAGIIIGSGSASFEIIRDLVEKLPLMIAPKWLNVPHQPIAIRDVIFYLSKVLGNKQCYNSSFDIGGPDILTYKDMLLTVAKVRGLKRFILTVPVLSPRLSSYWLYFVTSTSFSLARSLVSSMKNEVIARKTAILQIIPHQCISFETAVTRAFTRIEGKEIISSWKDAWSSGRLAGAASHFIRVPQHGCLVDHQKVKIDGDLNDTLHRVWQIGGGTGWYFGNFLWEIRGFIDQLLGGVGLRRGRRHPSELREGDALDFWRVLLADRDNGRLLLFAEMKLPGEAWLEFRVDQSGDEKTFHQIATFRPRGLPGRLYWYLLCPVHLLIFRKMAENVAGKKSD